MTSKAQPTLLSERIHSLDLLRGFAVLGILIMNITSFSQIGMAYLNPKLSAGIDGYNLYFFAFNWLFADQRFISLVSILFGAGICLFADRLIGKGMKPFRWQYRRMFFLLLFGLAHAYLIWFGDILVAYAICGSLVFLLRNLRIRTLWIIAAILYLIPIILSLMTYYGMPADELERTFDFYYPDDSAIAIQIEKYRGSYLEQLPFRIRGAVYIQTVLFAIEYFWRICALMIFGIILYRKGILSASRSRSFYRKLFWTCMPLGFILSLVGLLQAFDHDWNGAYMMNIGSKYNYVASIIMATAYLSAIMLWHQYGKFMNLQMRLRATGRMAFTNYILMSLICTFIFYGHGFGLYETFDRLQHFLVVVAIWILILFLSPLVLSRYRYGPLEWLWRKLTYGLKI